MTRLRRPLRAVCIFITFGCAPLAMAAEPACRVLSPILTGEYSGGCVDGLAHGHGVAKGPKATYRGEFVRGERHGKGRLEACDGKCGYDGEWRNDRRDGMAFQWSDDATFEGEFKDDTRHGYGRQKYGEVVAYEGQYFKSQRHGCGRAVHPNGSHYVGMFAKSAYAGQGIFTTDNGLTAKGEFRDGRMHGIVATSRRDGSILVAEYEQGKQVRTIADSRTDPAAVEKAMPPGPPAECLAIPASLTVTAKPASPPTTPDPPRAVAAVPPRDEGPLDFVKANQLIQSRCDRSEVAAPMGTSTIRMRRTGWTGKCVDGVMHGEGTITIESTTTSPGVPPINSRRVLSGILKMGQRVGPWRVDESTAAPFQQGYYLWEDAPVPGTYQRNADGSFAHVAIAYEGTRLYMKPVTSTPVIPAQQVEALRKAALEGRSAASTPITVHSRLLADLMPGGRVSKARESTIPNLRSKSVVIVVSSSTEKELAKLDDFFEQLRLEDVSHQDNPKVRLAIQRLWAAVDKRELLNRLTTMLRSYFKQVAVMNDLAEFKASAHDYAVVFDFAADIKGAELIQGIARHAAGKPGDTAWQNRSVGLGASFFLLNRELEVVFGQSSDLIWHEFTVSEPGTYSDDPAVRRNAALESSYLSVAQRLEHSTRSQHGDTADELVRYPYLFSALSGYLWGQKRL